MDSPILTSENLLEKFSESKLGEFAGKAMLPERILRVWTWRICWKSHGSREDSPSLNSENLLEYLCFQRGFSEFEFGEFAGKAMVPKRILRVWTRRICRKSHASRKDSPSLNRRFFCHWAYQRWSCRSKWVDVDYENRITITSEGAFVDAASV